MNMLEDSAAALRLVINFTAKTAKGPASVFDAVFREAANIPRPEGRELEVTAHFGASCLPAYPEAKRRDHLAKARSLARQIGAPSDQLESVDLMADALMAMEENAQAIAWCNQAAALTRRNPAAAASRLWRAGRCYVRAGFRPQAQAPLRAAIAGLRAKTGNPLLPLALLDLGNACLDSEPAEAESAYREAAEIWTAAGRQSQAATAWLNLGVLCSRADRLDEALAW
jgi:tetratricopeptide (TPR) repeat protein